LQTSSGKNRKTLAGNTKDVFRLIQSIPSKKAEPFKRWLAQVGKERLDEIDQRVVPLFVMPCPADFFILKYYKFVLWTYVVVCFIHN
jgi:hypothetical protein